jgi:hypothetical protein
MKCIAINRIPGRIKLISGTGQEHLVHLLRLAKILFCRRITRCKERVNGGKKIEFQ